MLVGREGIRRREGIGREGIGREGKGREREGMEREVYGGEGEERGRGRRKRVKEYSYQTIGKMVHTYTTLKLLGSISAGSAVCDYQLAAQHRATVEGCL